MIASLKNIRSRLRDPQLTERAWFNGLWFQSLWFTCVLGREAWLPLAMTLLLIHLLLVRSTLDEITSIAPVAALGVCIDTSLSLGGVFDFGPSTTPAWLALLWLGFAAALPRALAWFGAHPWRAAVTGAAAVPLNYLAGARMGAVSLPYGETTTWVILAAVWALLMPLCYRLGLPKTA